MLNSRKTIIPNNSAYRRTTAIILIVSLRETRKTNERPVWYRQPCALARRNSSRNLRLRILPETRRVAPRFRPRVPRNVWSFPRIIAKIAPGQWFVSFFSTGTNFIIYSVCVLWRIIAEASIVILKEPRRLRPNDDEKTDCNQTFVSPAVISLTQLIALQNCVLLDPSISPHCPTLPCSTAHTPLSMADSADVTIVRLNATFAQLNSFEARIGKAISTVQSRQTSFGCPFEAGPRSFRGKGEGAR